MVECNKLSLHPLFRRKGLFLYDYIDSFDEFDEACLPQQSSFYSKSKLEPT